MKLNEIQLVETHGYESPNEVIRTYKSKGETELLNGRLNEGCIYLTHAYIFALQNGDPVANEIHEILVRYGREE